MRIEAGTVEHTLPSGETVCLGQHYSPRTLHLLDHILRRDGTPPRYITAIEITDCRITVEVIARDEHGHLPHDDEGVIYETHEVTL